MATANSSSISNQKPSSIFDNISDNETDALNEKKNTIIKQQFLKHNNNNLSGSKGAEYFASNNRIRGRKTFAFWTLVCLLLLLAFGNLILTLTILGVLRLGHGMNSLELVPEASAIKFFGNTDLGHVYKVDGKINGFLDDPVEINSEENGSLLLDLIRRGGRPVNKLTMNSRGTVINNTALFSVFGIKDNEKIFSVTNPYFSLLNGADKLSTKMTLTNRVTSLNNRSLEIKGDTSVHLKGNEGTKMESNQIFWSADQDIYLSSVNGSLVFNGKDGISIDIKNIPIVQNENSASLSTQFKLCVCLPHGKLFKIPVLQGQGSRVNCNHIKMTPSYNPCM